MDFFLIWNVKTFHCFLCSQLVLHTTNYSKAFLLVEHHKSWTWGGPAGTTKPIVCQVLKAFPSVFYRTLAKQLIYRVLPGRHLAKIKHMTISHLPSDDTRLKPTAKILRLPSVCYRHLANDQNTRQRATLGNWSPSQRHQLFPLVWGLRC